MRKAFANYAVQWKWKHPSPWDFFMSMNTSLGKDLGWFWYEWFFTTNTFDQAIESVPTEVAKRSSPCETMAISHAGHCKGRVHGLMTETVTAPAEVWFAGSRTSSVTVPCEVEP